MDTPHTSRQTTLVEDLTERELVCCVSRRRIVLTGNSLAELKTTLPSDLYIAAAERSSVLILDTVISELLEEFAEE